LAFAAVLLITAMMTAIYTAFLFAQAKGRTFWQSRTVFLHMATHAILSGAAFLTLFAGRWDGSFVRYLIYLSCITAVIQLVVTLVELYLPHKEQDTKLVVKSIISGRYSKLFWGVAVLAGTIVPVVLLVIMPGLSMVAAVLFLFGVFASQHIWVRAPQQIPLS
jgi:formate-dependent nitrite reductase membrane component NrfD